MNPTVATRFAAEDQRVRAAYARRPRNDPRYSWASDSHVLAMQDRERQVLRLLKRNGFMPLAGKRILEIGCGTGAWLRDFVKWGARPDDIIGIDIRPDVLTKARQSCPPAVRIECHSATNLPFGDASFDLVLQATVLACVLDADAKRTIAAEMLRVVKRDGLLLWYDLRMDNPQNPDVRGLRKREIRALFPGCRIDLRRITLAAPLAHWLAPRSWLATYLLARIPPLCTHYLGAIRRG